MCDSIINEHVSIREASVLTGMCAQTLRKLGDQQKIKCYKTHSGQRKFDKASLIEMVKTNISLSNIVSCVSNIKDECDNNNIEGNPESKIDEYVYYSNYEYANNKKNIDDFLNSHASIKVFNYMDDLVDICLSKKNIKVYVLDIFFIKSAEYNILKKIINKNNSELIII
jgi:DNA-binding transcriptional MerR regulator